MRKLLLCLALAGCAENANINCPGIDGCYGIGFEPIPSPTCDANVCNWERPLDETCALGARAWCLCQTPACGNEAVGDLYVDCYQGNTPLAECWAASVHNDAVSCAEVAACGE